MRFRAKNAGYSIGLSQLRANSYWWPRDADGRSRDYNVTTKVSWLDRLSNLHSNGAPLARYALGLRNKAFEY